MFYINNPANPLGILYGTILLLAGANTKLASIAIVHMDEAGATASAMAVATLLFATGPGVKAAHLLLDRFVLTRFTAWRRRAS